VIVVPAVIAMASVAGAVLTESDLLRAHRIPSTELGPKRKQLLHTLLEIDEMLSSFSDHRDIEELRQVLLEAQALAARAPSLIMNAVTESKRAISSHNNITNKPNPLPFVAREHIQEAISLTAAGTALSGRMPFQHSLRMTGGEIEHIAYEAAQQISVKGPDAVAEEAFEETDIWKRIRLAEHAWGLAVLRALEDFEGFAVAPGRIGPKPITLMTDGRASRLVYEFMTDPGVELDTWSRHDLSPETIEALSQHLSSALGSAAGAFSRALEKGANEAIQHWIQKGKK
jgi:hypothetical protein